LLLSLLSISLKIQLIIFSSC